MKFYFGLFSIVYGRADTYVRLTPLNKKNNLIFFYFLGITTTGVSAEIFDRGSNTGTAMQLWISRIGRTPRKK